MACGLYVATASPKKENDRIFKILSSDDTRIRSWIDTSTASRRRRFLKK